MSGHSKWATIKHKKAPSTPSGARSLPVLLKEFPSLPKMAATLTTNLAFVGHSRSQIRDMPADNIKRAIQRGTGEIAGVNYEEFSLEGYGPAELQCCSTSIPITANRTVSEIRHAFGKNGGNMAEAGAVSWMFPQEGRHRVPKSAAKEDDLMAIVLEAEPKICATTATTGRF